jgi:hypothetical protein
MKTIINISVLAMMTAGIYGAVDLANDFDKGTLIKYDDGNVTEEEKKATVKPGRDRVYSINKPLRKTLTDKSGLNIAASDKKKKIIKAEYFSRGEEVYFKEDELIASSDSSTDIVYPQKDSSRIPIGEEAAIKKKDVKLDSSVLSDLDRSLILYSRAPLRQKKILKTVTSTADSLRPAKWQIDK